MSDAEAEPSHRPRGRLKIFLGAAPGVGKTYAMLADAIERQAGGEDVLVARAESHGRPEIEALLATLGAGPDAAGAGRPAGLDLDGLLARGAELVLVDDLAAANGAGARHPRRWQDVEELLAAGSDVHATLGIGAIESLSDVVAGITRVPAGETVPDGVFDSAEIALVDLAPDMLVRRLERGQVRVPDAVSRSLSHYFSRPTLSALRELTLRRAALSVDRRMVAELDAAHLPATVTGGERVLVAVSEWPGSDGLVRAGKRLSDALRAPWAAIYIETPRAERLGETQKRRVADTLQLAATLGATIATVPAETVVDGLIGQVESLRVTQLVIGKSRRSWWFTLRHGSVVDAMMKTSDTLAVHVLPAFGARRQAQRAPEPVARPQRASAWGRASDYGAIVGLIGVTTLLGRLAEPMIGLNAIDLVYLLPVILASTLFGLRPALATGLLAAIVYNFFFLGPRYSFAVRDPQAVIALGVLLGVAGFTSRLTGRLKVRATLGQRSAQENAAVAAFAQALARVSDRASTAIVICDEVARLLDVDAMLLAERKGRLAMVASRPDGMLLDPVDAAAAEWAWTKGEQAGAGTATLNAADWLFVPLKTSLGTLAVLGVARENGRDPVPADRAVLMSALVGQAALAHERLHLEDDMRQVSVLKARDRLRMSLLASFARDLGPPLGRMAAALGEAALDNPQSSALSGARREADRIQRVLADLAEMVRIDAGELVPAPEPLDLADAVSDAAHSIHDLLRDIGIDLRVPANLPPVRADARLLHHVLVNALSEAVPDAGGAATILVEGRRLPDGVELRIAGGGGAPGGGALGRVLVEGFAESLGIGIAAGEGALRLRFPQAMLDARA
ncbi:DUF4118 domain-containing protein [Sphingomonas morindae]|uniref:DUF4118 domain-containing protein n=1 Tax=Sphingomonas morindae TaxID=1541170 RepID=A0ABY4X8K7_9SPHN|nr:DUF4118 domain-containing protein [Sphingomonas morindae]USI73256.1 DUF4118 domain-containing protein [Sphingomonas morindae]